MFLSKPSDGVTLVIFLKRRLFYKMSSFSKRRVPWRKDHYYWDPYFISRKEEPWIMEKHLHRPEVSKECLFEMNQRTCFTLKSPAKD